MLRGYFISAKKTSSWIPVVHLHFLVLVYYLLILQFQVSSLLAHRFRIKSFQDLNLLEIQRCHYYGLIMDFPIINGLTSVSNTQYWTPGMGRCSKLNCTQMPNWQTKLIEIHKEIPICVVELNLIVQIRSIHKFLMISPPWQ